jgi:hypothetical protein
MIVVESGIAAGRYSGHEEQGRTELTETVDCGMRQPLVLGFSYC